MVFGALKWIKVVKGTKVIWEVTGELRLKRRSIIKTFPVLSFNSAIRAAWARKMTSPPSGSGEKRWGKASVFVSAGVPKSTNGYLEDHTRTDGRIVRITPIYKP